MALSKVDVALFAWQLPSNLGGAKLIDRQILEEVADYLTDDKRRTYEAYCAYVVDRCKQVKKEMGPNVVSRVYSRIDKQDFGITSDALKAPAKIAKKVIEKRLEQPAFKVSEVTDIVGATIVVQYPDQIELLLERITQKLVGEDIEVFAEVIERPGYYATHLDLFSNRTDFRHIFCELQIKTMLHDAWSAKMHDLNYKPSGSMDNRLDRLMLSLGNTLQAIEVQSETIRNLITERWRHDSFWRSHIREVTMDQLQAWSKAAGIFDKDTKALIKDVTKHVDEVKNWYGDAGKLNEFTTQVNRVSKDSPRKAWWLASYLAVQSQRVENMDLAMIIMDEWYGEAAEMLQKDVRSIQTPELWFVPMAAQAMGQTKDAISISERIVELFETRDIECAQIARFNLAHFLLEKEYFDPTDVAERNQVKDRIIALLDGCEAMKADDPSAFYDAEGMINVVFGEDPSEVRQGIDLLQQGRDECHEDEKEFAASTFELHARLAWRRLADLENSSG